MTSLWLSLLALLVLAIAFVMWPLWRYRKASVSTGLNEDEVDVRLNENVRIFREHLSELENNFASQAIDAEQFAQLKLELERNLLDDEASLRSLHKNSSQFLGSKFVLIFFALILAGGILLYQKDGNAHDIKIQALQEEKIQLDYQDMVQNREPATARTQELIAEYKARLEDKPDSLQYWFLLARSQMEISDFNAAVKSYEQVLKLDPQAPMVKAELAQAMFLRDGNKMSPAAAELAKSAITLDPKNTMALGLVGIDAFSKKNYREAITYWQKTIDLLGPDSPSGKALVGGIERAKQQYAAEGGKPEELITKSAYAVTVTVSLGEKAKVSPDDVVFIYARAWKGTPMPLAITRIKASDLPKTITLDETMAMSPMASLANATDIEVVARVSKEGTAQAKVGDWQAKQGPISVKSLPDKLELVVTEQITAESLGAK